MIQSLFWRRQLEYLEILNSEEFHVQYARQAGLFQEARVPKVKTIRYRMLRKSAQYENDTAEAEVEVEQLGAKRTCRRALGLPDPDPCCSPAPQPIDKCVVDRFWALGYIARIECGQYKLFHRATSWSGSRTVHRTFPSLAALVAYLDGREGR